MSSHVGASGVSGDGVCEGPSEEVSNDCKAYTAGSAARQRLRDARGPAAEGRSSSLDALPRPPLPGRKPHRGRWREGIQEREEAEGRAEKESRRGRQRWTPRMGTQAESSPFRRGREGAGTVPGTNSDIRSSRVLDAGEGSDFQMGPDKASYASGLGLNATSSQPPVSPWCSAPLHPSTRNRSGSLWSRTRAEEPHQHPCASGQESDPFREAVRTGAPQNRTPSPSVSGSERGEEEGEEEEEEEDDDVAGGGVMEVTGQSMTAVATRPCAPLGERRMSKREKNRTKCLRRRQRRKETRRGQPQETHQSSTGAASSSGGSSSGSSEADEGTGSGDREGYICAVCLDVYFSPYMCHPCNHIFCEPCLRTLARNSPANTPCPLCRTVITHVFFQKELNQTARTTFPKEYLCRKQSFQKASCAKWPLPSCRKLFHIFGGFPRRAGAAARRQLPRGGGYPLDGLRFRGHAGGWRWDMDMVIIYIYSVNWVVGFFVFCFLCYLFFPSF